VTPILPSPHGRPVIFQAGSSGRGMKFANKHAEVVFAIQPHIPGMQIAMVKLREAARAQGASEDVKMLFGLQPILGGTEAEAKAREEELKERIPLDAILARLSGVFGVDLSTLDPDKPLEDMPTKASQGLMAATKAAADGRSLTLREAAKLWALAVGIPQVTGTPEQVADYVETAWRESGCCGFNLSPTTSPDSIEDFVDQVVPILQKRGIYRT
jgi:alkanesulfonate monooxygenase SsuD/methylene tetrahydromethanopterin reductase-like flavin-dependent oxidoreductase (luciferase family)